MTADQHTLQPDPAELQLPFTFIEYDQDIFACASKDILAQHTQNNYNLSHVTIWCNSSTAIHTAQTSLRTNAHKLGIPSLLLPEITTLKDWVWQQCPTSSWVMSETDKQLLLVDAIKQFPNLFRTNNPWNIAKELIQLFDECAYAQISLSEDIDVFNQILAKGYTSHLTKNISRESEIIYQLWTAYLEQINTKSYVDPTIHYCNSLQQMQIKSSQQFYFIGGHYISPIEAEFLHKLQLNNLTKIYYPKLSHSSPHTNKHPHIKYCDKDLLTDTKSTQALDIIFQQQDHSSGETLLERIHDFKNSFQQNPLCDHISIFSCNSVEQHVNAICLQTKIWLAENKFPIGIVSNDRLLSRRIRAVFESAGIYAKDLGGWALSTTSAATIIEVYLDLIEHNYSANQLFDLMRSPFFRDDENEEQQKLILQFFNWLKSKRNLTINAIESYPNYFQEFISTQDSSLEEQHEHFITSLTNIKDSCALLSFSSGKSSVDLYKQSEQLIEAMQKLGITEKLAQDQAGQQVLSILQDASQTQHSSSTKISWIDWRQWLRELLENNYFSPDTFDQRITLCGLEHIDTHQFKSVALVGVEHNRLHGNISNKTFFNENVRHELGMRTHENQNAINFIRFRQLIEKHENILFTAESEKNNEPQELSPWINCLELFSQHAFNQSLHQTELQTLVDQHLTHKTQASNKQSAIKSVSAIAEYSLPSTLSATQYQTLIDCPYQFFCKYILNIKPQDKDEDLSASDFGNLVHQVLYDFHFDSNDTAKTYPGGFTVTQRDELIDQLTRISKRIFMQTAFSPATKQGWLQRWTSNIPSYIDWLIDQSTDWQPYFGETTLEASLSDKVNLQGQIDRIDQDNKNYKIIDFKTGANIPTKKNILNGEAVQLPFYHLLFNKNVTAEYLVLGKEATVKSSSAIKIEEIEDLGQKHKERILLLLNAIADRAPLPANGENNICSYCDYQGLCRKSHWS